MFSNASFTSYGLTPLLPPSVVAEGVTAVNNALHIRHRLTSLMRSYHRCQPAMEQVDTKLNQTLEMLGLSTLTSASWKEIIQGSYVGAVLSDPRAALEEPFSFSSIRHKSATSIHSMSFHSFQPPRRKFSTFNYQRHILHSPSSLSRGWRTIPGYYRSITEHKLRMLEDRANSETDDATIQAKYLKEVVSQDPAYVMRRYESGKYAIDEEVRSIYWQAVILLQRVSHYVCVLKAQQLMLIFPTNL
ncbi:uncharacterized protein [Dysidea avara]|uniref:uncharacterized protein isoform X2 n=1 Tax=Dysidea avara TaxID=196820 RepID=UPI0033176C9A